MKQIVDLDHLNQIVENALSNLDIEKPERDVIREVLMYAELRGSSQGLIKIKERTVLPDNNCTDIKIENKTALLKNYRMKISSFLRFKVSKTRKSPLREWVL